MGASTNLPLASPVAAALADVFDDEEVETALGLKADQSAVAAMVAVAETRLDNLEAKVNALLNSLRASGQIVT